MLVRNIDTDKQLVNGTRGVVVGYVASGEKRMEAVAMAEALGYAEQMERCVISLTSRVSDMSDMTHRAGMCY